MTVAAIVFSGGPLDGRREPDDAGLPAGRHVVAMLRPDCDAIYGATSFDEATKTLHVKFVALSGDESGASK